MYIIFNEQIYPNVIRTSLRNGDILFSNTELDDVSGEIITYRDDGFELARDNTEDFLRVAYSYQTFKLTNEPEPIPIESGDESPTYEELKEALELLGVDVNG